MKKTEGSNKDDQQSNLNGSDKKIDIDTIKTLKSKNELFINRLVFRYPQNIVQLWVSAKEKPYYKRIHFKGLPQKIHKIINNLNDENPFVWINTKSEKDDKELLMELKNYPSVAKYWLSQKIYDFLVSKFRITKVNFTGDNEYWQEEKNLHRKDLLAFSRYTIKVETFKSQDTAYLWLSFNRVSFVLTRSIEKLVSEYQLDTKLLGSVIHEKKIHHYKKLNDEVRFDYNRVFPILRREIAEKIGLDFSHHIEKFKMTNNYDHFNMFFNKYLNTDDFKKIIPHSGKWNKIKDKDIFFLHDRSRNLVFGGNNMDTEIYKGIKKYGSASFVKYRNIKWFLIYREKDKQKAAILMDFVNGKKGFIRLSAFTGTAAVHDVDRDIVLADGIDMGEEVRQRISHFEMDTDTAYFAFYLSPFKKTDPRPEVHIVYYKIKEALLNRDIMSQAIDLNKFNEQNFGLSMTNIGIAMTAKLKGKPWLLPTKRDKELIIGFGAYKCKKIGIPYIGSAFCFDNKGEFQEFDCWPAKQEWALHATLAEAINKYKKNNPDIECVVIHYFKDMKRKDLKKIENLIDDLDENIPIIVVRFNSSFNNSEIIINENNNKKLPENACYVRLKNHQYLLHINSNENGCIFKDAPFPLKLSLQSNRVGLFDDDVLVEKLMRQVYEFCMLHWRSVKQPRIPVTVAYPRMVAEIFPWFDGEVLPDAARKSLWFL